jgi:hypothetical protein
VLARAKLAGWLTIERLFGGLWDVAGVVAATLVFAITVIRGSAVIIPLVELPLVLSAAYGAFVAFVMVWMLEGIYLAVLWVRRRLGGTLPTAGTSVLK